VAFTSQGSLIILGLSIMAHFLSSPDSAGGAIESLKMRILLHSLATTIVITEVRCKEIKKKSLMNVPKISCQVAEKRTKNYMNILDTECILLTLNTLYVSEYLENDYRKHR
jgi:hypothetical protein